MINLKELIEKCVVVPNCMKIETPFNGFTRYLAQCKNGEPYMESNMKTNFVFYEPNNKKVFKLFSFNEEKRKKQYEDWNSFILKDTIYYCQNIEFINDYYQEELNYIFSNPNEELAKVVQDIADKIVETNPDYKICIGVVHGEQLTKDGVRYPHLHLLLEQDLDM